MCSRWLQGDVLQRKGGTSSHAGPLAATSPKVEAMPKEVTWCQEGKKGEIRGLRGVPGGFKGDGGIPTFMSVPPWQRWRRAAKG